MRVQRLATAVLQANHHLVTLVLQCQRYRDPGKRHCAQEPAGRHVQDAHVARTRIIVGVEDVDAPLGDHQPRREWADRRSAQQVPGVLIPASLPSRCSAQCSSCRGRPRTQVPCVHPTRGRRSPMCSGRSIARAGCGRRSAFLPLRAPLAARSHDRRAPLHRPPLRSVERTSGGSGMLQYREHRKRRG